MSSSIFINRLAELQEGQLYGRPALLRAYQKLCRLATDSGYVPLSGGVRGWSAALSVGLGYVKSALCQLAEAGIIACDFIGDGLAEIYLVRPLPTGCSVPERETVTAVTAVVSHERSIDDRSLNNPYMDVDHESIQQQQHAAVEQVFDLPDETVKALRDLDAHCDVIHRIAVLRPSLTAAKVLALYDDALTRPDFRTPNGPVLDALMQPGEPRIRRGRAVSPLSGAPPGASSASGRRRPSAAASPPAITPDDMSQLAGVDSFFRLGSDTSDLPDSPPDRSHLREPIFVQPVQRRPPPAGSAVRR